MLNQKLAACTQKSVMQLLYRHNDVEYLGNFIPKKLDFFGFMHHWPIFIGMYGTHCIQLNLYISAVIELLCRPALHSLNAFQQSQALWLHALVPSVGVSMPK